MSKVIAFIPARGGSKSIPLKNIKPLAGQSLILWSIQELVRCKEIDEIWVATDSEKIERVVLDIMEPKVKIFKRSHENAQDGSSTEDVMLEFIDANRLKDEIFILVQATSPFTKSVNFSEAINEYREEKCDSLLSGVVYKRFFWNWKGETMNYDYTSRPRRQDYDGVFLENGAFYISNVSNIKHTKNRLSGNIMQYVMEEYTATEIDEDLDWLIAESLIRKHDHEAVYASKKKIELVISDVDGVLTDAGMYYSENGDELKKFNTHDGMAFQLLREKGIKTAIITSEDTELVARRAKKMNVDFLFQGKAHGGKLNAAKAICKELNIELSQVAYIGDDLNCLELLSNVGLAACPNNAISDIKEISNIIVLNKNGGEGVFREFMAYALSK